MTYQRRPHILKPTVGSERPTSIIWFDTETRQHINIKGETVHSLRLGYAVYYRLFRGRGYAQQSDLEFTDLNEFWAWVDGCIRAKSSCQLVAHNIVFDLSIVHAFDELSVRGWKLSSFYSKAVTSIFRWSDNDRRLIGLDNMNLFSGKLEKWGELFGYPKGHVDFNMVGDGELMTYCKRDVEIMVKSWFKWLEFLDTHDLGNFRVTIGSTALSSWRYRFMKHKVFIHNNPQALELERAAYHGGRTECFWSGERSDGPFYYLDVNNMYGFVLSEKLYPVGIWNVDTQPTLSRLLRKLEKQSVIGRVRVRTDEPIFPIMRDGFTTYPTGEFDCTLSSPELIYAFNHDALVDVYRMVWYKSARLFKDYIKFFHGLRMKYRTEHNDGYEQIAKMMMNSLYGKFGQSGFDQKRIGNAAPGETWTNLVLDARTGQVNRLFALAGGVYEEHRQGESSNSFPAIAAHVTAYARLYLWELIKQAGYQHAFYCDTDSLIVDQQGYDNLKSRLDPDRLGWLKVEHTSQRLSIRAPKDYSMDERVRIKGVVRSTEFLGPNLVEQDQWQRLGGQLQAGDTNDFIVRRVRKNLSRLIRSGVVGPSGWVTPFDLTPEPEPGAVWTLRQLVERP
jgi:hypothetical protein